MILALLTLLPLVACGESGGPLNGRVLEEGTLKPLPGAIVVAKWVGDVPAFAESKMVCIHVESTVAGQEGKFSLPRWSKPSRVGLVLDLRPVVTAYKLGYGQPGRPSQSEDIVLLGMFKGTTAQRVEYLARLSRYMSCSWRNDSEKNLIPLRKALHEEATTLAQTRQDRRLVESILYDLEIIELGFEVAEKRHLQRVER